MTMHTHPMSPVVVLVSIVAIGSMVACGKGQQADGGVGVGGRAADAGASGGFGGLGGAGGLGGGAGTSGDAGSAEAGGADAPDAAVADAPGASDAAALTPIIPAFADMARTIAAGYLAWGRVDDELRWAPFLCRIPLPGIARPSESQDQSTHGQKLYSVFAKKHDAYPNGPQTDQVVVKQSWTAELVTTPDAGFAPGSERFAADAGDHFYAYAHSDGGVYRAAQPAGLYIMFKLPPATADTDEGWVYATITATGEVTAAGRVAKCMDCHEVATHERLFGVPLSPSHP